MIDPRTESELTGGGDCFAHWHSADRVRTHDDVTRLDQLETSAATATSPYTVPIGLNYLLVDTTAGNVTVNLPTPSLLVSITIIKKVAGNVVTVQPPSGTINGAATYPLNTAYQSAKFKSLDGINYVVVA